MAEIKKDIVLTVKELSRSSDAFFADGVSIYNKGVNVVATGHDVVLKFTHPNANELRIGSRMRLKLSIEGVDNES